jgi:hypothetical protein
VAVVAVAAAVPGSPASDPAGTTADGHTVVSLEDRPDLVDAFWDVEGVWPLFMQQDPVSDLYYPRLPTVFPEYQQVMLDPDGSVVARVNAVPFAWHGVENLPLRGWDAMLETAFAEQAQGIRPSAVSLIEARVSKPLLGRGLSAPLIAGVRAKVRSLGHEHLVGPVRPTLKALEPNTPMVEYVQRVRADGLPFDPWLRVHVRLGGTIGAVCPLAMIIPGTLAQWREWTGLPFDRSGPLVLGSALSPVHVSVEQDHAVYVEPNVWVHHQLTRR